VEHRETLAGIASLSTQNSFNQVMLDEYFAAAKHMTKDARMMMGTCLYGEDWDQLRVRMNGWGRDDIQARVHARRSAREVLRAQGRRLYEMLFESEEPFVVQQAKTGGGFNFGWSALIGLFFLFRFISQCDGPDFRPSSGGPRNVSNPAPALSDQGADMRRLLEKHDLEHLLDESEWSHPTGSVGGTEALPGPVQALSDLKVPELDVPDDKVMGALSFLGYALRAGDCQDAERQFGTLDHHLTTWLLAPEAGDEATEGELPDKEGVVAHVHSELAELRTQVKALCLTEAEVQK
jgi:hypothetical protein